MAASFIVTANRTDDGSVVYLADQNIWTAELERSLVTSEPSRRDEMLAWARTQEAVVCDPYPITVEARDGQIEVVSARERIRAGGPEPVLRRLGLLR